MILVALQTGLQPLVTKRCVDDAVAPKSMVLAENAVTTVMCLSTLMLTTPEAFAGWSLFDSVALAGPPAVVYAVRSLCKLAAYRLCDGVTFNVINQTKSVFCAIAAWILLGESQTLQQCMALLFAISAGAILVAPADAFALDWNADRKKLKTAAVAPAEVVMQALEKGDAKESSAVTRASPRPPLATVGAKEATSFPQEGAASEQPDSLPAASRSSSGVILAIATAMCSGVAAALSQWAFRRSSGSRPSALFTLELALYGAPFAIMLGGKTTAAAEGTSMDNSLKALLRGWRRYTLTPVALQALGGILVGVVVKQHGGVAMGLCTIIGIAVAAIADAAVTGKPPSLRQTLAAALAAWSIVVHQKGAAK